MSAFLISVHEMYMLIYLFPFLLLICLWLQRPSQKLKRVKGKQMFHPVRFLVMRMEQRQAGTLHSLWTLQLRYGITDNRPAEGKNSYHFSLPAFCLECTVKKGE